VNQLEGRVLAITENKPEEFAKEQWDGSLCIPAASKARA
jgi:hypothetical protein